MNTIENNYYTNNQKYSDFLESQDAKSFEKFADLISQSIKKGGNFLDIGCGTGTLLALVKEKLINGQGVDISKSSIKIAQAKGLQAKYYSGKVLPFEDSYFDGAGSYNVLEHTQEPIDFLNEQLRVIKPGGYLFISCPNFLSITNSYHWHTAGLLRKLQNLFEMIRRIFMRKIEFGTMHTIDREEFQPDDDASIVTNPITILRWAKSKKLSIVNWSSQPVYGQGAMAMLDKWLLKYFMGSTLLVLKKP